MSVNSQSWKPSRLLQSGPVMDTLMSLSRWLNLKLYGVSGPMGAQPTPPRLESGGMYLVQTGAIVTSTDASGITPQLPFPSPFPNGILTIIAHPLGPAIGSARGAGLTSFNVTTNTPSTSPITVCYIAIGY